MIWDVYARIKVDGAIAEYQQAKSGGERWVSKDPRVQSMCEKSFSKIVNELDDLPISEDPIRKLVKFVADDLEGKVEWIYENNDKNIVN